MFIHLIIQLHSFSSIKFVVSEEKLFIQIPNKCYVVNTGHIYLIFLIQTKKNIKTF
jgi:hypothetical protein